MLAAPCSSPRTGLDSDANLGGCVTFVFLPDFVAVWVSVSGMWTVRLTKVKVFPR